MAMIQHEKERHSKNVNNAIPEINTKVQLWPNKITYWEIIDKNLI